MSAAHGSQSIDIREYDSLPEEAAEIRAAVFGDEQGFVNEFDDVDGRALHIVAFDGDVPVACCRLFSGGNPSSFHLGRLAVVRDRRGEGLGAQMMEAAEDAARIRGAEEMVLSAQVRASGFYSRLGYERRGEEYLDEFCPHIDMHKRLVGE